MTEHDPARQLSTYGRHRPLVYEWVGEPVFFSYMNSMTSLPKDLSDAQGEAIAVRGVYVLREVSTLGVVVRKVLQNEPRKLAAALFVPWSSVYSIQGLPKDDEEDE